MLFSEYKLKGITAKNRIVFPPVVCMGFTDEKNHVTQKNIDHYTNVARGGSGLIITEAVSIEPTARLSLDQIGAWDDDCIEGLAKIATAVHNEGLGVIAQIHHGVSSPFPARRRFRLTSLLYFMARKFPVSVLLSKRSRISKTSS